MSEKLFLNETNSSNSKKKTKKSQKAQPNPIHEKFSKLLVAFEKVLTDWKSCALSGNSVITDKILTKKKDQFSSGILN